MRNTKLYNKLQSKMNNLMTFEKKSNEDTFRVGMIIIIIVVQFSIALFFYENYFTISKGLTRYGSLFIIIPGAIMGLLFLSVLFKNPENRNNIIDDETEILPNQKCNLENSFKDFFKEDFYYLKFKNTSIEIGLIDNNCKWLFQKKEVLYFALLINKLKKNNYLKSTIENKDLCEVSNKLFDIKIGPSMLSKYDPYKEKNTHLKGHHLEYYENVYNVYN